MASLLGVVADVTFSLTRHFESILLGILIEICWTYTTLWNRRERYTTVVSYDLCTLIARAPSLISLLMSYTPNLEMNAGGCLKIILTSSHANNWFVMMYAIGVTASYDDHKLHLVSMPLLMQHD
jgi:hypothetical protein